MVSFLFWLIKWAFLSSIAFVLSLGLFSLAWWAPFVVWSVPFVLFLHKALGAAYPTKLTTYDPGAPPAVSRETHKLTETIDLDSPLRNSQAMRAIAITTGPSVIGATCIIFVFSFFLESCSRSVRGTYDGLKQHTPNIHEYLDAESTVDPYRGLNYWEKQELIQIEHIPYLEAI